jgi:hypothetical protein
MNCPKCQGGSYLADEEAVKVIETASPAVIIIRQTFICRACADRFSRIVTDDAASRRALPAGQSSGVQPAQAPPMGSVYSFEKLKSHEKEQDEKVKFLD